MAEQKPRLRKPGPAWRAAERYGCDMSLIECNLCRSPAERLHAHGRILATIAALRRATGQRDA